MKVEVHIKRQMVRIFGYECNSSNTIMHYLLLDVIFDTLLGDFQVGTYYLVLHGHISFDLDQGN